MQIFYIFEEISNRYPQGLKDYMQKKIQKEADEDYFQRPNNLRELCTVEHQMPFLMHYLKDMRNESVDILVHPRVDQWCRDNDVDLENLANIDDDKLLTFRELVKDNRTRNLRGLGKTMDSIFDNLIDIAARRVPQDGANVKIDHIAHKIRFIFLPDGIIEDTYEETVTSTNEEGELVETVNKIKSNIAYKAILHLKVQQREEDEEVPDLEATEEAKDGEQKTKIVTRMVDEDQGGRALSIVTRGAPGLA